jgi:mono/diheme cytochrome c family protein
VAVLLALAAALGLVGCDGGRVDLGARIYATGQGGAGPIAYTDGPDWLPRGAFGCAVCHGESGEGRFVRVGAVSGAAPPIHGDALAARGYDEATLRRALVEGVAVDGRVLNDYMPRWQLSPRDLEALASYLDRF